MKFETNAYDTSYTVFTSDIIAQKELIGRLRLAKVESPKGKSICILKHEIYIHDAKTFKQVFENLRDQFDEPIYVQKIKMNEIERQCLREIGAKDTTGMEGVTVWQGQKLLLKL